MHAIRGRPVYGLPQICRLGLGPKSGSAMEALAILTRLNGKLVTLIAILLVVGGVFVVLAGLSPDQQTDLCGSFRITCRSACF